MQLPARTTTTNNNNTLHVNAIQRLLCCCCSFVFSLFKQHDISPIFRTVRQRTRTKNKNSSAPQFRFGMCSCKCLKTKFTSHGKCSVSAFVGSNRIWVHSVYESLRIKTTCKKKVLLRRKRGLPTNCWWKWDAIAWQQFFKLLLFWTIHMYIFTVWKVRTRRHMTSYTLSTKIAFGIVEIGGTSFRVFVCTRPNFRNLLILAFISSTLFPICPLFPNCMHHWHYETSQTIGSNKTQQSTIQLRCAFISRTTQKLCSNLPKLEFVIIQFECAYCDVHIEPQTVCVLCICRGIVNLCNRVHIHAYYIDEDTAKNTHDHKTASLRIFDIQMPIITNFAINRR